MWSEGRGGGGHSTCKQSMAAVFHLVSLFLVMSALVQLDWFHVRGCNPPLLGPKYFMAVGHFDVQLSLPTAEPPTMDVSISYHSATIALECVTPEIVSLMRVLIFLCILCVFSCMVGFCLDLIAPTKKGLSFIKRNALPALWAEICVISMFCVSYFLACRLESAAKEQHPDEIILVGYDEGFFAVSIAGGSSLIAIMITLLAPECGAEVPSERQGSLGRHRLIDDDPFDPYPVSLHQPPPAYAPPPYSP